jgi:hypothetical protein
MPKQKKAILNKRGRNEQEPQSVLDMQTRNIQIMKYESLNKKPQKYYSKVEIP